MFYNLNVILCVSFPCISYNKMAAVVILYWDFPIYFDRAITTLFHRLRYATHQTHIIDIFQYQVNVLTYDLGIYPHQRSKKCQILVLTDSTIFHLTVVVFVSLLSMLYIRPNIHHTIINICNVICDGYACARMLRTHWISGTCTYIY